MVTAVTTLLVAIAGLVTAAKHLGGDGGSEPAAVTVQTTASSYTVDPALRAAIPAAVLPSCGEAEYPEETAIASTNCRYHKVVKLQYNLFASDVDLRQNVEKVRKQYGDKHECGKKPLLCFVQATGEADIVWVDEKNSVMGFAWRDDGDLAALYESWSELAG